MSSASRLRRTLHTGITSYGTAVSGMAVGLLTIRLATRYLSQEEFGLFSFTMQSIGYLLLLDLGVANSLSRLFGEPLASGDRRQVNGWFTMGLGVLALQALVIVAIGFLLRDRVISWFDIPPHLHAQAARLWGAFLVIQAAGLMMRVAYGILFAQNRVYWTNIAMIVGPWAGLAAFALMLHRGGGVMAYAWSSGVATLVGGGLAVLAVALGPNRFGIDFSALGRRQLKELFTFSFGSFIAGIAVQVLFASQGLVITKLLGLDMAAVYNVTSRATMLVMPFIWKPFDAFPPRWLTQYCSGAVDRVRYEFPLLTRVSFLLAACAAIGIALANPAFVRWWTKPEYYGGDTLNLLLAAFLLVQTSGHCYSTLFSLLRRLRAYVTVVCIAVPAMILGMIAGVHAIGLAGVAAALVLVDLAYPAPFYVIAASRYLGVRVAPVFLGDLAWILASLGLAVLGWIFLHRQLLPNGIGQVALATATAGMACLPALWRIVILLRRAAAARQARS